MANNTYNDFTTPESNYLRGNLLPSSQLDQLLLSGHNGTGITLDTNNYHYVSSSAVGHPAVRADISQFWEQDTFSNDLQSFGVGARAQDEVTAVGSAVAHLMPTRIIGDESASTNTDLVPGDNAGLETNQVGLNQPRRRTRKQKAKAPPESEWLRHKATIGSLHFGQGELDLKETCKVMKDTYDFNATPSLYKQKFREWGWMKNVPKQWTSKLVRLAEDRQPKDTIFELGYRKWTAGEMKKRQERKPNDNAEESPILPSELIIRTPSLASPQLLVDLSMSPPRRQSQTPVAQLLSRRSSVMTHSPAPSSPQSCVLSSHHHPSFARPVPLWTPYNLPSPDGPRHTWSSSDPAGGQGGTASYPLCTFRVNGKSITDIEQRGRYAKRLASQGQVKKAIDNFEEVLRGFRKLLPTAHESTMETAYELADLLRQDDRMAEADATLNWIGENYVRRFGLQHEKTMKHFAKVFALLKSWSRQDDGFALLCKMADLIDSDEDASTPTLPGGVTLDAFLGDSMDASMDTIFGELKESGQVDAQLRLAEVLIKSHTYHGHKLESALRNIISFSTETLSGDIIRLTRARYWLVKIYLRTTRDEDAHTTLEIAIELLKKHITDAGNSALSMTLVAEARKLAFLHPNRTKCDELLELLADHFEDRIGAQGGNSDLLVTIEFLIQVGVALQKKDWNRAAPWFERALGICLTTVGTKNSKTIRLEKALEDQRYEMDSYGIVDATKFVLEYEL